MPPSMTRANSVVNLTDSLAVALRRGETVIPLHLMLINGVMASLSISCHDFEFNFMLLVSDLPDDGRRPRYLDLFNNLVISVIMRIVSEMKTDTKCNND